MAETSYQMLEVLSILRSREGLTSFNIHNSAIFSNEKEYNDAFRDEYFLRIREKT